MKRVLINWVNYIYVHIFKRKHIFNIVLNSLFYERFDRITTGRENFLLLGTRKINKEIKCKIISVNKLLIK